MSESNYKINIETEVWRTDCWCERRCENLDSLYARAVEPDDFCSRGERKYE